MGKIVSEEVYQLSNKHGGNGSYESCRIQDWLRTDKKVLVLISPIDSWDSWKYTILMEDIMSSFYEPDYNKLNEFKSYEDALEAGLKNALEIM